LGLATVYAIVRQAGGFISVHSKPDEGTRFELYFPVVVHGAVPMSGGSD
jgi:signal transduction histidine kinase